MAADPDAAGKAILGQDMSGGYLQPLSPNASREEQVAVLNDIISRLNDLLKTQILSDEGTKRFLFGYQKDGWGTGKDFGMKISMEGIDVTKASDDQLLFKMDMATWRFFDPDARNYVNIGNRSTNTYGFEMAGPGETLDDPPA